MSFCVSVPHSFLPRSFSCLLSPASWQLLKLPLNEDKASRYHRLSRQAAVISLALAALVLGGLLLSGASRVLADAAASWARASPGRFSPAAIALYVVLLAAVQEATAFPLRYYRGFFLEHHYGLSSETHGHWLRDHAKAAALGLAIAVAGAEVVYFLLTTWPEWWWLASAAVFTAAMFGLAKLLPLVLLPIFYKFTPLDRESLRARLVSLSERAGVPVLGVYEWGLGEKTRRANAALVGTGGTRRIIVSDTLLAEYSDDEIEVILAHELAHHVHRDILTSLDRRVGAPARLVLCRRGRAGRGVGQGSGCGRRQMWRVCRCCCLPAAP